MADDSGGGGGGGGEPKEEEQQEEPMEDEPMEEIEIEFPVEKNDAEEPQETDASFRRKLFGKAEDAMWDIAAPIAVRDLTVKKDLSRKSESSELPSAPNFMTAILGAWLTKKLGCMGPPAQEFSEDTSSSSSDYIISNISAVLNPGEATLIIAPSSSGKTTFMRTIANACEGHSKDTVEGTVKIGGLDPTAPEHEGWFRRSTAFADQGDLTLTPVLTVQETCMFAGLCANPSSKQEIQDAVAAYLRLAGLSHVAGTVVGNADIRGVSGGQKRRVKVLEMCMGDSSRILFLDEITNGLDAASALSNCENFVVAVEQLGIMAMACLLQPSTEAFNLFHRLVILTQDGEMVYSGLRQGALAHFESFGLIKPADMDEPEFLLRCAFKPEDYIGEDSSSTVKSSSDLVARFADSSAGQDLQNELDEAESPSSTPKEQPKVIPKFARSTGAQLKLLIGRGWKLVIRDPGTFIRVFIAIIFGFFVGTLFLNTPGDIAGTGTRTGYVFTMLLLLFMTGVNAPVDAHFNDRGTFYTHRQAEFYSTGSYYLSNMLCSWPTSFLEATFMSVCSFFLVGMEGWGGGVGFLYFWLMALLLSFCGCAFSRILAYSLPSPDVASTLGPAILIVFILTAGYAPQYPNLPNWLRWLSWASPVGYAMEGIVVNELWKRNIDGTDISGNEFGIQVLNYPRIPYNQARPIMNTPGKVMAFDAYLILCFMIVFEIVGFVVLRASRKWYGPTTNRYEVTSGMSLTSGKGTMALLKGKKAAETSEPETTSVPPAPLAHLTAQDIVYEVDVTVSKDEKKDEKGKADDVHEAATVESDEPVLVTTREYGQKGKGAAKEWAVKRAVGEQALSLQKSSASFVSSSSIRVEPSIRVDPLAAAEEGEASDLEPAAPGRLRLLSGVSATFTPKTMTALMGSSGAGKTTLLDVLAGYKTGGHITGKIELNKQPKVDETWRAIAGYCEQADLHNPTMTVRESLVFAARMRLRPFSLPEDTKISYCEDIMKLLEIEEYADIIVGDEAAGRGLPKHARKRLTLGVELVANPSILFADEPTSGLDSLSASLVVSSLKRAATLRSVTVVCTIHQPSKEVFESFDYLLLLRKGGVVVYNGPIPNISNYMTAASGNDDYALKAGTNPADHALDILCGPGGEAEDWGKLYKQSDMARDIGTTVTSCSCESCESGGIKYDKKKKGAYTELKQVLQRQLLSHWRTPTYMAVRFWWTVAASLLVALIFMNIPKTTDGAADIIGAMFSFINLATVPLMSSAIPLIQERAVFYRETSTATYSKTIYAMAVQLAEVPFNILMAVLSWVIFYWLVGLDRAGDRVIYFFLMTVAAYWVLPLFGQLFSFVSPNIGTAMALGGLILTVFVLTMGFLIAPSAIPGWWIWLYWINPLRYILQGVAVNELGGQEYVDQSGAGKINGDDILSALGGWSFTERWWYCYVVVLLFGFGASAGLMGATRINWMKR